MNLDHWSFALSAIGLVLGIVSAYPQLRSAAKRALALGADGAIRMTARLNAKADFFIACPSALIAYIALSVFVLTVIFMLIFMFVHTINPNELSLPSWLRLVLALAVAFVVGKLGGDLLNVLRLVMSRAIRKNVRPRGV